MAELNPVPTKEPSCASKLIKDCLTGINGVDYDPARVYGAMAVLTFIGLAIYAVVGKGQPWDARDFGIGFGMVLAGFGLGVRFKSHTEEGQS
ncbi:MAG: hypothetical protein ACYDBH_00425 [Acidobacteriaceae bacterium]